MKQNADRIFIPKNIFRDLERAETNCRDGPDAGSNKSLVVQSSRKSTEFNHITSILRAFIELHRRPDAGTMMMMMMSAAQSASMVSEAASPFRCAPNNGNLDVVNLRKEIDIHRVGLSEAKQNLLKSVQAWVLKKKQGRLILSLCFFLSRLVKYQCLHHFES